MNRLLFTFPLFLLLSVPVFSQKSKTGFQLYPQLSLTEMRILDTISRLYEVRAKRAQVLEKYSGSRIVKPVIYKRPSSQMKYYWVKVVEDNAGKLTTHYNFYVNEKNLEIRFLDPLKDKEMTLREWRKGRGW